MALSIDPKIFNVYNEAVENIWNRNIVLIYPEIRQECPNCTFNGFKSNGVYKTGGPYPFEEGFPCPWCEGTGFKMVESTETIPARVYYSKKDWVNVGAEVQVANAAAQIVANMDYLPKLQQCKYCIPAYYPNIDNYNNLKLRRISDFFPQGFLQNPKKYIVTFWETFNDKG
jgi:hypothetical protein